MEEGGEEEEEMNVFDVPLLGVFLSSEEEDTWYSIDEALREDALKRDG